MHLFLAAEVWSSEKDDFVGSESTCRTVLLVDQSLPDFFVESKRNCCQMTCFPILDIAIRSGDIRDRSLKWSEVSLLAQTLAGTRVPNNFLK